MDLLAGVLISRPFKNVYHRTAEVGFSLEIHSVHPKFLALAYGAVIGFMTTLGIHLSLSVRSLLLTPTTNDSEYYSYASYHGLIMIFFYLMPLLYGVFGNHMMAHGSAVSDMLFPRLNIGGAQQLALSGGLSMVAVTLGVQLFCGWVLSPPVSLASGVELVILSLHLAGLSSILTSLNLLLTSALGHREHRLSLLMPLVFASFNTGNVLVVLSLPVLAAGITMLLLDKSLTTSFYIISNGGDALMYQHLFWFFGHPEVYILILPVFGLETLYFIHHVGKYPVNGFNLTLALAMIGALSCGVWGHHLYTIHLERENEDFFSWATVLIGVPTGIKYFSWTFAYRGSPNYLEVPTLATFGFLYVFLMGGVTGVLMGNSGLDLVLHDTYYVVGHFHLVMAAAVSYLVFLHVLFLLDE